MAEVNKAEVGESQLCELLPGRGVGDDLQQRIFI